MTNLTIEIYFWAFNNSQHFCQTAEKSSEQIITEISFKNEFSINFLVFLLYAVLSCL